MSASNEAGVSGSVVRAISRRQTNEKPAHPTGFETDKPNIGLAGQVSWTRQQPRFTLGLREPAKESVEVTSHSAPESVTARKRYVPSFKLRRNGQTNRNDALEPDAREFIRVALKGATWDKDKLKRTLSRYLKY